MIIEIMGKMLLCLIIALLLGFLIGWLFSKALTPEKRASEEYNGEKCSEEEEASKMMYEELEEKYEIEKALAEEYASKNRELKGELMKKITILQSTSEQLKDIQNKDKSARLGELEKSLKKKEAELLEFETVLLKAEQTIEKLSKK